MTGFARLRLPIAIAAATAGALLFAGPASAHIDPDPPSVVGGSEATVSFVVEHGCEGSPTTKVEIQVPEGFTGIAGVNGDGFTATVDGQVVTFSGGVLPDDTEKAFLVTFTPPNEPGTVPVKLIQTCEEGSTSWIEIQAEGEEEPEHPAPMLTITKGTTDPVEGATTTTTEAGQDDAGDATTTTTLEEPSNDQPPADGEDESSSSAPIIIGAAAAVAVIGGGGYLVARSRKNKSGTPDPEA